MAPIVQFANFVLYLINVALVPLIFAVAFIVFIWGVYTYFILGGGNSEKREEGRSFIIYSLIGFFIMLSVWGLVNLITFTFGFQNQRGPAYLPGIGGGNYNSGGPGGSGQPGANPSIFTNEGGTGLFDMVGSLFPGGGSSCVCGAGETCVNGACVPSN